MHDMVPAYRTRQVQVINSITWPRKHAFSNFQMDPRGSDLPCQQYSDSSGDCTVDRCKVAKLVD